MKIPTIAGTIDRRILANYRIDPSVMAAQLPAPFKPQLVNGWAIGGICLIRMKHVRPAWLPLPIGLGSENAAHRIAVTWETNDGPQHGVYIPRRDTNSTMNAWAGGRVFPGLQHLARFDCIETESTMDVNMVAKDQQTHVHVKGHLENADTQSPDDWPSASAFNSLQHTSDFFKAGSLGHSGTHTPGQYEALSLDCDHWSVQHLLVDHVASSHFDNANRFPPGSVHFDHALLMRHIPHRWHGHANLCCSE